MAHWPIRSDVRFGEPAQRELQLFIERAVDLGRIIASAATKSPTSQSEAILGAIASDVGMTPKDIRILFNSLENLKLIQEDQGSIDAALDRIQSGLPQEMQDAFVEARPKLKDAADLYNHDNPVSLSFKAQRLTYLRERLFHDVEIITDARPVFDDSGQNIVEFVITHELVITHYKDGDFQVEHMSVDNSDIVKLRRACDRAIIKAKTLKEALGKTWTTEVLRDEAGS